MSETTARELLPGRGALPFWQRVIGELQLLRVNLGGGWRNAKFHSVLSAYEVKQMYDKEGIFQPKQLLSHILKVKF